MKPPSNQVDKHGFPVPPKFEDDAPPHRAASPRRAKSNRGRLLLSLMLVGIAVAIVAESPLGTQGRAMWIQFLHTRAQKKYLADDLPGALADLDSAVAWLPAEGERHLALTLYVRRAQWRLENKQLEPALEDATRAVELWPKHARPYLTRSFVYQRLGEPAKAIADLNLAVQYREGADADPLNARAYARALAGVELNEALDDVEKAIRLRLGDNAAYLDTRGYIHFLLGDQQAALADLDKAIDLAGKERKFDLDWLTQRGRKGKPVDRVMRSWDQTLSVMLHHRGEVFQKLGQESRAADDLLKADQLGYNPAEGVF